MDINSFQPTYEELKLDREETFSTPFGRFQPTYEELKLNSVFDISIGGFCFQPTYEELKHYLFRWIRMRRTPVFSLPMRN